VLAAVRDLIRTALKLAEYVNTVAGRRAPTERHRVLALYGITRSTGHPRQTRGPDGHPLSAGYAVLADASVKSICLDLRSEDGHAIVLELARRGDVVLQAFRAEPPSARTFPASRPGSGRGRGRERTGADPGPWPSAGSRWSRCCQHWPTWRCREHDRSITASWRTR
jgi:hypothetical protein